MKPDFLKLECRIQRWNTTQPGVFLIKTSPQSLPTAVYNRNTFESMDNSKGLRPRPNKTHAYTYNRNQDDKVNTNIEKRATYCATAEEFARKILEAAQPIDRQTYLEELDRIIWPSQEDRVYNKMSRVVEDVARSSGVQGLDLIAQRSSFAGKPMDFYSSEKSLNRSSSRRKQLLRQLTDLISKMDEEDLAALLKLARTLEEE